MPSPGAARHHLAAIPHRLLKWLIRPRWLTETTATECGRSSERRAIAPASKCGEDATRTLPTQLLPTRGLAELHEVPWPFPAAWTNSVRSLARVDPCATVRIVLGRALRSSASVYFSTSPANHPKLRFRTSGPPRAARPRASRAEKRASSAPRYATVGPT